MKLLESVWIMSYHAFDIPIFFPCDTLPYPQAHENLGTAYMLLGDHNKSIVLLEKAVQERKHFNQQAALALPLARLSAAYCFQGSKESIAKSEEIAKEALKQRDTIPWAGMTI